MAKDTKLGPPIDLSRYLGQRNLKNRIVAVGVELEGGWDKLPPGTQVARDTSVQFPDKAIAYVGEVPSPPLELSQMPVFMRKYYPHHVNATCGMHVHVSLRTAFAYQRLIDPRYPGTVVEYFKQWATREALPKDHSIWERLAGNTRYCQHVFHPEQQVATSTKDHDQRRVGHRYTVINYCHARLGTIECRLLPMMGDVEQAIRAIQFLITVTHAYLVATGKQREPRIIADVRAEEAAIREELRGRV